eukprot:scaffold15011_cov33-Tisochrysis_lutea.AAC.1
MQERGERGQRQVQRPSQLLWRPRSLAGAAERVARAVRTCPPALTRAAPRTPVSRWAARSRTPCHRAPRRPPGSRGPAWPLACPR